MPPSSPPPVVSDSGISGTRAGIGGHKVVGISENGSEDDDGPCYVNVEDCDRRHPSSRVLPVLPVTKQAKILNKNKGSKKLSDLA